MGKAPLKSKFFRSVSKCNSSKCCLEGRRWNSSMGIQCTVQGWLLTLGWDKKNLRLAEELAY